MIITFLQKYPSTGGLAALAGFLSPYIDLLSPVFQFGALVLGVLIGLLTVYAKWLDVKERRKRIKSL